MKTKNLKYLFIILFIIFFSNCTQTETANTNCRNQCMQQYNLCVLALGDFSSASPDKNNKNVITLFLCESLKDTCIQSCNRTKGGSSSKSNSRSSSSSRSGGSSRSSGGSSGGGSSSSSSSSSSHISPEDWFD